MSTSPALVKPFLRGHFHQGAFYFALGACAMLIAGCKTSLEFVAMTIYSVGLVTLFGVSSLYHRINWKENSRLWMKRMDHAAIFIMIAATGTPLGLLALKDSGQKFLIVIWVAAFLGVIQSLFWVKAPKWLSAVLYVAMGWLASPYISEIKAAVGFPSLILILIGGLVYTLGAVIYAVKKPNPWPKTFGYHEIFHILTIVAATLHFIAIVMLQKMAIS
ncbi:hemolysin III family protein [Bdellovibrio sp.]|uniref:PAQR family membrane homeostasis protein TrhA n=1 Tax=Bdellovibrio sp. TaxID=28201 RepID=UPI003221D9C2